MNRKSTSSIGAFHPILFFVVIYGISLFLSFFVCRSVYYGINGEQSTVKVENAKKEFQLASAGFTASVFK
ncbi:MAG: hypothetical protein ABIN57_10950 [Chitinophagaceae bacterium]